MACILIAEDEPCIARFIKKGLLSQGYDVLHTTLGTEVADILINSTIDLLLLDLGLPGMDGLEVLEVMRGQGISTPVIIITARDEVSDKITGLDGGADDYITKPFRFDELLARIRARLRTRDAGQRQSLSKHTVLNEPNGITLNLRTRQVFLEDYAKPIDLSEREFKLLELLISHPGEILCREQILDQVWGYCHDPGSNIVDVYIGYLRKKIGVGIIETVRGVGYRLTNV